MKANAPISLTSMEFHLISPSSPSGVYKHYTKIIHM
jgi:hypothetical protein